jgi:hypothetical protein
MSEIPTNREGSRHVDVRVHFLRDMVRDGSVNLIKCAGTQNVADALAKSLPRPAFHKHREFLKGTAQSFSAFFASAYEPAVPAYVTKRVDRLWITPNKSLSLSLAPTRRLRVGRTQARGFEMAAGGRLMRLPTVNCSNQIHHIILFLRKAVHLF